MIAPRFRDMFLTQQPPCRAKFARVLENFLVLVIGHWRRTDRRLIGNSQQIGALQR